MKTNAKHTVLKAILGGAFLFAALCGLKINSSDTEISLGFPDAYAVSGSCCKEVGSICVIGTTQTADHYYKAIGSCESE